MTENLSRRDFLKLCQIPFYAPVAKLAENFDGFNTESLAQGINPKIDELGDHDMFKGEGDPVDGTNGFRASYVSNDGQTIMGGTEMGRYHLSKDFGKSWEKCNFTLVQRPEAWLPTPRDIVPFTSKENVNNLLLVNDYNVDILFKNADGGYYSENIFPTQGEGGAMQTAVCLPNGKIIVGGNSLVGGIFATTETKVLNTIKYNQLHPSQKQEFEWENKYEYGNPRKSLVRSIFFDKNKNLVYIGGWSYPDNRTPLGMGVLCLNATTLEKVDHIYDFKDDYGEMPVNTINVIQYKNSEIMVQGMERSGIFEKGGYQEHGNTNFLKIWVDGKLLSDEIVNCQRLAKYGSGWDIVSCGPGGTETIEINDQKYLAVCMLGGGISVVPLSDVVSGKKMDWQRITYAPVGQTGFNAFRAKTITNPDTQKQELIISRLSWKGGGPQRFARVSFD